MGRFEWLEFSNSEETAPEIPAPAAPSPGLFSLERMKTADGFFFAGLYGKALREYSRAIDEDKYNRTAWERQNICQIALHEYNQAVVWAQKFVEFFPDDPQALSSLAFAKSRIPEYLGELPALMQSVASKSCGMYSAQMLFEKAACLFALQKNEEGQQVISAMLEGLDTHIEQTRWMIRCAAYYLDSRVPDCACILLESLANNNSLNSYAMSLWIKAEWLRSNVTQAQDLLRVLRKHDPLAPGTYEIEEYFSKNPPQPGHAVRSYFGQLFDKLLS